MKRLLILICSLPLFALNTAACGDSESTTDPGAARLTAILALTGDTTAGKATFEGSCALGAPSCHNADGTAGDGKATDLSMEASGYSDERIINSVLNGLNTMPAQSTLGDDEIANILAHIRSEWP